MRWFIHVLAAWLLIAPLANTSIVPVACTDRMALLIVHDIKASAISCVSAYNCEVLCCQTCELHEHVSWEEAYRHLQHYLNFQC
jgi:hypothetical protein